MIKTSPLLSDGTGVVVSRRTDPSLVSWLTLRIILGQREEMNGAGWTAKTTVKRATIRACVCPFSHTPFITASHVTVKVGLNMT